MSVESVRNRAPIDPKPGMIDICDGADPFLFKGAGEWILLLQGDLSADPYAHDGIKGYTIRTAPSIPDLVKSIPQRLVVGTQSEGLNQVWAGEIHDNHLYVAASNGNNETHRMHVFRTCGDYTGVWEEIGQLKQPKEDDSWAIDLTLFNARGRSYAAWSGWQNPQDGFPQNIYLASAQSPVEIGPRTLIAKPEDEWSSSVAALLEAPQALVIEGEFRGLLVTGNASWTDRYETRVLKFRGGDPLDVDSWKMTAGPLFKPGYGIGHGVIEQDGGNFYYVGHRKTSPQEGWEDRKVFATLLTRREIESYLS